VSSPVPPARERARRPTANSGTPAGRVAVMAGGSPSWWVLVDHLHRGEEMAGRPLLPGEHLNHAVYDPQIAAADVRGAGQRVRAHTRCVHP